MTSMRRLVVFVMGLLVTAAAGVAWLDGRGDASIPAEAKPVDGTPAQIARGAYLARIGNCLACHTAPGGAPYAGGRGLATPFGTVYASNLTPDVETGLGRWSPDHFWRAIHHGRSFDGRRLYPAFPYPEMTRIARDDSDALYAYLRSLPPVRAARPPHALRFPYDQQAALAVWRALFFRPAHFEPDAAQSAEWNRGAYLVRAVAHCVACHGGRNALGATPDHGQSLAGGLIPMQNWYAPALTAPDEAGVADWPLEDIAALLKDGVSRRGSALGPMGEVVQHGTQHLAAADLRAVSVFLKSLPQSPPRVADAGRLDPDVLATGEKLYGKHCADCHGAGGEGAVTPEGRIAYPALAGNRTLHQQPPANLVRVIAHGGFAPSTAGNPRPFGMPPFAPQLSDAEIAALATWLRNAWGAKGEAVTAPMVGRYRGGGAD